MRSRSSRGRDSNKLKEGSKEAACDVVGGLLPEGFRRRARRLGDFGGASSMVVSEEPLLPLEDRDRDRGVEVREAILWHVGIGLWSCDRACRAGEEGRREGGVTGLRQAHRQFSGGPAAFIGMIAVWIGRESDGSGIPRVLYESHPESHSIINQGLGIRPPLRMGTRLSIPNHLHHITASGLDHSRCLACRINLRQRKA
jgi:hypothetical protein